MGYEQKPWWDTLFTLVWVFNTGRGLAVCVRFPHNIGVLYDLGAREDFSPARFAAQHIIPKLRSSGSTDGVPSIAQVVLSHPHADHLSELSAIVPAAHGGQTPLMHPMLLTCPHDKSEDEAVDFARVNNPDSSAHLMALYRDAYAERTPPLRTIESESDHRVPNVEYGLYYVRPPACSRLHPQNDQDYSNSLSIVLYVRHGHQSVLVPGDITPDAMRVVLSDGDIVEKRYTFFGDLPTGMPSDIHRRTSNQPGLRALLRERGLTVLLAPHHGLQSGYCEELAECIRGGRPSLNVISEKRHLAAQDGQVDSRYQSDDGAKGVDVDVDGKTERRASVSTRNGHHVLVVLRGTTPRPDVFLRARARDLLPGT